MREKISCPKKLIIYMYIYKILDDLDDELDARKSANISLWLGFFFRSAYIS